MPSSGREASEKMDVAVVGGGAVGLCAAYYALRAGKRVTVFERGPEGGDNCSAENAGMVVPSHFVPLAAPGVISLGLRWMLDRESPFALRLRPRLDLLRWAYLFWRHANPRHVAASRELLRDLNLESRRLFVELAEGWGFGLEQRGLLMLCGDQKGLDEEAALAASAGELGLDVEVCDPRRLAEVDPDVEMAAAGGVWFKQDCHMDPGAFLAALRDGIRGMGGEVRYGVGIDGFVREGGRVRALRCLGGAGEIEADQFVLAGGVWSVELARDLGLSLPMQAGKGYSLTLPGPAQLPRLCSILTEARVAVTPMGGALRFAGTMEIGGIDTSVDARRVGGIAKSVSRYFPRFAPGHFDGVEPWVGLRPCSPDGLPYIGPAGRAATNAFVATGHSMLGLSMAPVTGQLVAQLLCGERPGIEIAKLAPGRF